MGVAWAEWSARATPVSRGWHVDIWSTIKEYLERLAIEVVTDPEPTILIKLDKGKNDVQNHRHNTRSRRPRRRTG